MIKSVWLCTGPIIVELSKKLLVFMNISKTVGKYMHSSTVTVYYHRPWREPGTANPRNTILE